MALEDQSIQVSQGRLLLSFWGGLFLVFAFFVAWELGWRAYGYEPNERFDDNFWAIQRMRVPENDPNAVVFVGTSRSFRALVPDSWQEMTGMQAPVQLSVPGSVGQLLLEHFADDPQFRGLIILDMAPDTFMGFNRDAPRGPQYVYSRVRTYESMRTSPAKYIEARLRLFLQQNLVSFIPQLGVPQFYTRWAEGRKNWFFLDKQYLRRFEDITDPNHFAKSRERSADEVARRVELLKAKPMRSKLEGRGIIARDLRIAVEKIRARGGEVVFVYHPITGRFGEMNERAYPRKLLWNYFAQTVPGVWIHFKDYKTTYQVEAIDWSHLSLPVAREYTKDLAKIVLHEVEKNGRPRGATLYTPDSPLGKRAAMAAEKQRQEATP